MKDTDVIDHHQIIRETVGYEVLNQVPIEDMPKVMEFLKIVYNFNRMKRVVKEDEEPGWVDPMMEMLDKEEKESEWQRRRRLDIMKKKALEEEKEKIEHLPVSGPDLSKYHGKSPPAESWMDQYYYEYTLLRASGMMFEFHPEWTGQWGKDKYAFCHEQKKKQGEETVNKIKEVTKEIADKYDNSVKLEEKLVEKISEDEARIREILNDPSSVFVGLSAEGLHVWINQGKKYYIEPELNRINRIER